MGGRLHTAPRWEGHYVSRGGGWPVVGVSALRGLIVIEMVEAVAINEFLPYFVDETV